MEIYKGRDDDFTFVKSQIPIELDVIFIDTLHEARHVKKFFIIITII